MLRILLIALSASLICACAQPSGSDALVRLSLELPRSGQVRLAAEAQPHIKSDYRAALHLRVSADDMSSAISAEALLQGDEAADGRLELEMKVPSGSARRFEGLLFTDDLKTYGSPAPLEVDLPEGGTLELELSLKRLSCGSLRVDFSPAQNGFYLALEEQLSALRMPAISCTSQSCLYDCVPLGLSLTPVLIRPDSSENTLPAFELDEERDSLEIEAAI